jgi:hypothetical protein
LAACAIAQLRLARAVHRGFVMKKTGRKLQLSRVTLRTLTTDQLGEVAGGQGLPGVSNGHAVCVTATC